MTTSFAHLGLPDPLVRALAKRGVDTPFPVQAAAIPDALAGRDVCGKAPTGSGKTLAFGLPVLARVERAHRHQPRALILAPTRELAEQIKRELGPLAGAVERRVSAVYGGVAYGPQKGALRKGVDVLVATPGRLEDLMEQGVIDLAAVDLVVIDEADRMADMGFLPAVRRILDRTSQNRQTLLFSATLDGDVAVLSREYQHDPRRREAAPLRDETGDVEHFFWLVAHEDRVRHAADIVGLAGRSIVFTRTRRGADRLAKRMNGLGVGAVALHGGRSQGQRSRALREFDTGRAEALIATDVAARGIHIDAVASVIHFDPPADTKDYVHRSGRTARAGAGGTVVSLVTGQQRKAVHRLQRELDLDSRIEAPQLDRLARVDESRVERPLPNRRRIGHVSATASPQHGSRSHGSATSVYVANLPWSTTTEELEALFAGHGAVAQTTIISDRRTGRSKGFGFVDMPVPAARSAIDALHGSTLRGRDLTVRFAQPRRYGS